MLYVEGQGAARVDHPARAWDDASWDYVVAEMERRGCVPRRALVIGADGVAARLAARMGSPSRVRIGVVDPLGQPPPRGGVAVVDVERLPGRVEGLDLVYVRSQPGGMVWPYTQRTVMERVPAGGLVVMEEVSASVRGCEWPQDPEVARRVMDAAVWLHFGGGAKGGLEVGALRDVERYAYAPEWQGGSPGARGVAAYIRVRSVAPIARVTQAEVTRFVEALEQCPEMTVHAPEVTRVSGVVSGLHAVSGSPRRPGG